MIKRRKRNKFDRAAKQIKNEIKKRSKLRKVNVEFFSSGCTMINLAVSGKRKNGVPRCRVTNFVGDGSSGKTLIALETCLSFLKTIPKMKSKIFGSNKVPKVIYNNGEGVMDFPLEKMYGQKFIDSIKWRRSKTIESVGRDYMEECKKLKENEALLYIIDSWDSFKSIHDTKILEEKDEDIIKGFNMKKQQFAWSFFSEACEMLEDNNTDATLIVISQTKQKIGVVFGKKKYRTGGDALNFYTHLVPWIRVVQKLSKTKNKESKVYGMHCELKVERSKVGLSFRSAEFAFLFDYGMDDILSNAMYLKKKGKKKWEGIKLEGKLHDFCLAVEERGLQKKLAKEVEKIWNDIEDLFQEEVEEREYRGL